MVIINERMGVRQNGWHQLTGLPVTTGDLNRPTLPAQGHKGLGWLQAIGFQAQAKPLPWQKQRYARSSNGPDRPRSIPPPGGGVGHEIPNTTTCTSFPKNAYLWSPDLP